MFGFIRPFKPEMKIKEFDSYKAVYCGLCKTLKKDYGFFSRFMLDYDLSFMAMVLMAKNETFEYKAKSCRCISHPFKKCEMCEKSEELSFCAGVLVLLGYFKILDNISDKGFFKKLGAIVAFPFAYKNYKKARKRYPDAEKVIRINIEGQNKTEKEPDVCVDKAAHYSAAALGELFALEEKETHEDLYKFGYMVGRYVYLCDAAADLKDDEKKGNFNPFKNKSSSEIDASLNMTLGQIAEAYQKLKLYRFTEILTNIIYLGMPYVKNRVVFHPDKKMDKPLH